MDRFIENLSIFCNFDGPRRVVLHSGPRGVAKMQNRAISRDVLQKAPNCMTSGAKRSLFLCSSPGVGTRFFEKVLQDASEAHNFCLWGAAAVSNGFLENACFGMRLSGFRWLF